MASEVASSIHSKKSPHLKIFIVAIQNLRMRMSLVWKSWRMNRQKQIRFPFINTTSKDDAQHSMPVSNLIGHFLILETNRAIRLNWALPPWHLVDNSKYCVSHFLLMWNEQINKLPLPASRFVLAIANIPTSLWTPANVVTSQRKL